MKFFFIAITGMLFFACNSAVKKNTSGTLKFEKDTVFIPALKAGNVDSFIIKYWNTGMAPCKIINTEGSCSCTAVSFDTSQIYSKDSGFITIRYRHDGETLHSELKNVVFLTTGLPSFKVLYLKTVVK